MTVIRRITAAALAAVLGASCVSCGGKTTGDSSGIGGNTADTPAETSAAALTDGDAAENVPLPAEGTLSELITPAEGTEEYDLGSYRIAADGVKIYCDGDYPDEVLLALDRYFTCFAEDDYEGYLDAIYPSYAEKYDAYLQEEYAYGLETSFESQCSNLQENMDGAFHVTRVRAEDPVIDEGKTRDEAIEDFFAGLNEHFGMDYYAEVRDECGNNFQYMVFYVIAANDETGDESLLVSGFEIIFAEKDGKYYVFG